MTQNDSFTEIGTHRILRSEFVKKRLTVVEIERFLIVFSKNRFRYLIVAVFLQIANIKFEIAYRRYGIDI